MGFLLYGVLLFTIYHDDPLPPQPQIKGKSISNFNALCNVWTNPEAHS